MIRFAFAIVCAAMAGGCVSPPKPYLPVDNQLKPWQAPEMAEEEPAAPTPAKKPSK